MKPQQALRSLKKGWGVCLIALLGITINAFDAHAEGLKAGHQKMHYNVYAGGIHALEANLDINTTQKDRFSIELFAKTYGLLGKLAPWFGTFETHGWFNKQASSARPELHQSTTTWKKELEVKKYKYNKDGTFKEYTLQDDEKDGSPQPVDKELTDQSTDILSAMLEEMLQIAAGQECQGASEIFDGKRRYKLIFNHKGIVDLKKSKYNVFEGKATECTIKIEPKGGKWHAKPRGWFAIQEQGREAGSMPTVWFGQVDKNETAVPVKVRAKTSYGTFFLHLTSYESEAVKITLKN